MCNLTCTYTEATQLLTRGGREDSTLQCFCNITSCVVVFTVLNQMFLDVLKFLISYSKVYQAIHETLLVKVHKMKSSF